MHVSMLGGLRLLCHAFVFVNVFKFAFISFYVGLVCSCSDVLTVGSSIKLLNPN